MFRRNGKFRHPNNFVANGIKQPKPKIFALFPQAVGMVNEFVLSLLDHVTSEMFRYELIAKKIGGRFGLQITKINSKKKEVVCRHLAEMGEVSLKWGKLKFTKSDLG